MSAYFLLEDLKVVKIWYRWGNKDTKTEAKNVSGRLHNISLFVLVLLFQSNEIATHYQQHHHGFDEIKNTCAITTLKTMIQSMMIFLCFVYVSYRFMRLVYPSSYIPRRCAPSAPSRDIHSFDFTITGALVNIYATWPVAKLLPNRISAKLQGFYQLRNY
jgi:hypothetical protein